MSTATSKKSFWRRHASFAASVLAACFFTSGCASWPQASPDLSGGKIRPAKVAVLPVRVFVQAAMDESQSIDRVTQQMRDIYPFLKERLRSELEAKGYKIEGEILAAQSESDAALLSSNPEYAQLSSELLKEFADLVNVIGKKRSNVKHVADFRMGTRIRDLGRLTGDKADAYLFAQTQAYLESGAVRSSRIAKSTVASLAVGVATLGMVIPVPQTQSLSRVKHFTALVDARTGQILYFSALDFPGYPITEKKTIDEVVKKSYAKLPRQAGEAGRVKG